MIGLALAKSAPPHTRCAGRIGETPGARHRQTRFDYEQRFNQVKVECLPLPRCVMPVTAPGKEAWCNQNIGESQGYQTCICHPFWRT
jgi:hypothetical protein